MPRNIPVRKPKTRRPRRKRNKETITVRLDAQLLSARPGLHPMFRMCAVH